MDFRDLCVSFEENGLSQTTTLSTVSQEAVAKNMLTLETAAVDFRKVLRKKFSLSKKDNLQCVVAREGKPAMQMSVELMLQCVGVFVFYILQVFSPVCSPPFLGTDDLLVASLLQVMGPRYLS